MQVIIFLILIIVSASAKVIDLGSLVIEGEVRRPLLTKIVSKNRTVKMIEGNASIRMKEIEEELLKQEKSDVQ